VVNVFGIFGIVGVEYSSGRALKIGGRTGLCVGSFTGGQTIIVNIVAYWFMGLPLKVHFYLSIRLFVGVEWHQLITLLFSQPVQYSLSLLISRAVPELIV